MARLLDFIRRQLAQAQALRGSDGPGAQRFGRESRQPGNLAGILRSSAGDPVGSQAGPVRTEFGAAPAMPPPAPPVTGTAPPPMGMPQAPAPQPPPMPSAPALNAPSIAAPPPKTEPLVSRALTPEPPIEESALPAEDQYGPAMPSEEELAMLDMNQQAENEASARGMSASGDYEQFSGLNDVQIGPGYKTHMETGSEGEPMAVLEEPEDLEGWKGIPDDYDEFLKQSDARAGVKQSPQIQLEMVKLLRKAGEAAPWEIPGAQAAPVRPMQ